MKRPTPLKDAILYLLSYMHLLGQSHPANEMVKIIYKHSGRYADLDSARNNIGRELRNLRNKGLVIHVIKDHFGSDRREWKLTDEGIEFILAARGEKDQNIRASSGMGERDLVNPSQSPLINLQNRRRPGGRMKGNGL